MEKLLSKIKEYNLNVFSVTEIKDGQSTTVRLKPDCNCRNTYSVAKAFTMAAIGFLYDEKKLTPQSTIKDIFGALPEGSDEKWHDVTVHNLLQHKTGLVEGHDMDYENLRELTDGDWLDFVFSLKIEEPADTVRRYNDLHYYVLSCIVTKLTGVSEYDYMRDKLFNPLKFRESAWSACPAGRSVGGTGLYISTEDMAKLGQLYLQDGVWEGKRLLSHEWIAFSLENSYAFGLVNGERQYYEKGGLFMQKLTFSYAENRVIAIEAFEEHGHGFDLFDAI